MDRRSFLKMFGLGCLIPFFKLEEPEAIYYGREEQLEIKADYLRSESSFESCCHLFRVDYVRDEYEYIVAPGLALVEAVYRDGITINPTEYIVHTQHRNWTGFPATFVTLKNPQGEVTAKIRRYNANR